jgi:hypothetical protein
LRVSGYNIAYLIPELQMDGFTRPVDILAQTPWETQWPRGGRLDRLIERLEHELQEVQHRQDEGDQGESPVAEGRHEHSVEAPRGRCGTSPTRTRPAR